MAPNFPERLQNSRENPASDDAKALLKELTPVIMITGGRIPFSPLERGTRASVELWSMIRMMGFPNEYWTVGLDETRSAIVARHACFKQSGVIGDIASAESRSAADFWHNMGGDANGNYDFNLVHHANNLPQNLPDLDQATEFYRHEIGELITKDPTAVVLLMQRMIKELHETLIGIPSQYKKTRSPDFSSRLAGLLGRAKAFFDVTELQGRKALHWHGLYWTGLPGWLVQRVAGSRLGDVVAAYNRETHQAHASPRLHALKLIRRMKDKPLKSGYFCPPPSDLDAAEIADWGEAAIVCICGHSHCMTCHKGNRGDDECRLAYNRATGTWEWISPNVRAHRQPRVIRSEEINTEVVPRACIAQEPLLRNYNEDEDGDNQCSDFEKQLRRIAIPGGDQRLLEYPQFRPRLSIPAMFDGNEILEKTVLNRQMVRLLRACKKLNIEPPQILLEDNLENIRQNVEDTMNKLFLGVMVSMEGCLNLEENPDINAILQALPEQTKVFTIITSRLIYCITVYCIVLYCNVLHCIVLYIVL